MLKIGNKVIGEKPYIIAEAGMNHNGSIELAQDLIEAAAKAGADAIKFQTFTADELVVKDTPRFWEHENDTGKDQWQAYEDLGKLGYEWYPHLISYCEKFGIEFLSTPFSFEAAEKLNELGMRAFKVASSDMSTLPYLEFIARFGKPILLSTGASTLEEVREAVKTIKEAGNDQIVLLHCVLCYPTKPEDANLNVIQTLKREFPDLEVGISDHTLGVFPSVMAMAMGAKVVEKHFTVDKTLKGNADHWLSVDPTELSEIVCMAKDTQILGGSFEKEVLKCEKETREFDKRSIVTTQDIPTRTVITKEMLTFKRPGTGIWPKHFNYVVGKTAKENIPANTILKWTSVL